MCDYDPPEDYEADVCRAGVEYKCEECQRPIAIGDMYEDASGNWDGAYDDFQTCLGCVEVREAMMSAVAERCFTHGGLDDEIRDHVDYYGRDWPGPPDAVGRLFGLMMRRRLEAAT